MTAAIARTKSHKPSIRASGTYEMSWTSMKLLDGATVTNTARHARFVEVGRRPGRMPPHKPIAEWVKLKRIGRPKPGSRKRRKPGRKSALHAMIRRAINRVFGGSRPALPGAGGEGEESPGGGKRRKPKAKQYVIPAGLVFRIRRKIGREGTKGRYILRDTMPLITKRVQVEFDRALTQLNASPPRR